MSFKVNDAIFLYIRDEDEEQDGYFYATIVKRGKRLVLSINDLEPEDEESATLELPFPEELQERVQVVEGDELEEAIPDADFWLTMTTEEFETV